VVADRTTQTIEPFPNFWLALAILLLAGHIRHLLYLGFFPTAYIMRAAHERFRDRAPFDLDQRLAPWVRALAKVGLVALVLALATTWREDLLTLQPTAASRYPVDAATFLKSVKVKGRLYNPAGWGGYLSYHLFPGYRVFADGRRVEVGEEVNWDGLRLLSRSDDGEPLFRKYRIEIAIIPMRWYVSSPALARDRWYLAYRDDIAVVLLRDGPSLGENMEKVCDFYRKNPKLKRNAVWAGRPPKPGGESTPIDVPSALSRCSETTPVIQGSLGPPPR